MAAPIAVDEAVKTIRKIRRVGYADVYITAFLQDEIYGSRQAFHVGNVLKNMVGDRKVKRIVQVRRVFKLANILFYERYICRYPIRLVIEIERGDTRAPSYTAPPVCPVRAATKVNDPLVFL